MALLDFYFQDLSILQFNSMGNVGQERMLDQPITRMGNRPTALMALDTSIPTLFISLQSSR